MAKIRIDEQLLNCIKRNRPLEELTHIGRVDGRIDLKGVAFPKPGGVDEIIGAEAVSKPYVVKKYDFNNVDFSNADLSYTWFEKCSFTNCVFENTNMKSVRLEAMQIIDCIFIKTNLQFSGIGIHIGKDSGEIRNTIFKRCNLSKTNFNFPLINETFFDNCTINDTDFDSSRFTNCTFKGKIEDTFFRGYSYSWKPGIRLFGINYKDFRNPMMNVDFTECELDSVSFTHGIDLAHCKFPKHENYVLVKDIAYVYGKAKEIMREKWPAKEAESFVWLIDSLYYNKDRKEQQMDLLQHWTDQPGDKKFFDLVKQINDTVK